MWIFSVALPIFLSIFGWLFFIPKEKNIQLYIWLHREILSRRWWWCFCFCFYFCMQSPVNRLICVLSWISSGYFAAKIESQSIWKPILKMEKQPINNSFHHSSNNVKLKWTHLIFDHGIETKMICCFFFSLLLIYLFFFNSLLICSFHIFYSSFYRGTF